MQGQLQNIIDTCTYVRLCDSKTIYPKAHTGSQQSPVQPLELLVVESPQCEAVISIQGAQLLSFAPRSQNDWLWLSPNASFAPGSAIRGGIPICLPWFGVNKQDPSKPKHGFVRNHNWQLIAINEFAEVVEIHFRYTYVANDTPLFESAFSADYKLELGDSINLELVLTNLASRTSTFSWAWHSYFAVEEIKQAGVYGLEDLDYLDNTQALKQLRQTGAVDFRSEVDRVYETTARNQKIVADKKLTIEGENCPTCIVWNPGELLAQTMQDVGDDYQRFVCVERGSAFADHLILEPNATHHSTMRISKTRN